MRFKNDKITDVIVQQFRYRKGHISFHVQQELYYFYLDRSGLLKACTIAADERGTARETEYSVLAKMTQSSAQPRTEVRTHFPALAFSKTQTWVINKPTYQFQPQSALHYKAKERAVQPMRPFTSERSGCTLKYPYFSVFLNHSQNMFCVKNLSKIIHWKYRIFKK